MKRMKRLIVSALTILVISGVLGCGDVNTNFDLSTEATESTESALPVSYDDITIGDKTYSYVTFDDLDFSDVDKIHKDEFYFIIGKIGKILLSDDKFIMYELDTEGGEKWAVRLPGESNSRQPAINNIISADRITVCGEYGGYSSKLEHPMMMMENVYIEDELYDVDRWIKGKWKDPKLTVKTTLEELSYEIPENWDSEKAPNGFTYYPFEEGHVWGKVTLSYHDIPEEAKKTDNMEIIYKDIIFKMSFSSDAEVTSQEMVKINGIDTYKVCAYYKNIEGMAPTEIISYSILGKDYYYNIRFFEVNGITDDMREYSDEFISHVSLIEKDEDDESSETSENGSVSEKNKEESKPAEAKESKPAEEQNKNIQDQETPALSSSGYQAILDEYTVKIKNAAPILVQEYKDESAGISDMSQLASLSNKKVSKLAEISNEGVGKMATYMHKTKDSYDNYNAWAQKLMDVYIEEAEMITDAYMSSFGY